MSNYMRAGFCLAQTRERQELIQWFEAFEALDCKMIAPDAPSRFEQFEQAVQQLLNPIYGNIEYEWHINRQIYEAQIRQIWHPPQSIDISFDVAEEAFFGGHGRSRIEYTPSHPNDNLLFQVYKQLIVAMIQHLKPTAGMIDYEMDIVCDRIQNGNFMASWGTYLSATALEKWNKEDIELLRQIVDEAIWIDNRGLLAFIHPLAVNQAWTSKHIEVQQLLDRNPIV